VPAKLSARARLFATGQGRKSDPADAHSVAVVALRTEGLQVVAADGATVALRLLADRRDGLGHARTDTVNRLHRLLPGLLPAGRRNSCPPSRHAPCSRPCAPRDIAGRTRRQLASELISELTATGQEDQGREHQLTELVAATGSGLQGLNGIGPSSAGRLLGDIGDITRFADRGHFASWNGTAPTGASSGDQHRHRLSRAGNRRINRVLHIMATAGSATTPKAAPTTAGSSPVARPAWKPSGVPDDGYPTSPAAR